MDDKWAHRDVDALMKEYDNFVHYVIFRMGFTNRTTEMYDAAYTSGLSGLWQAIVNYDPTQGFKFTTYAAHRIRGAVKDYHRELFPRARSVLCSRIENTITQLEQERMREITWYDLEEIFPPDTLCMFMAAHMVSLDEFTAPDTGATWRYKSQFKDASADFVDHMIAKEANDLRFKQLMCILNLLPPHHKRTLINYYIGGLTMTEIGALEGVSESAISQRMRAIERTLRHPRFKKILKQKGLDYEA